MPVYFVTVGNLQYPSPPRTYYLGTGALKGPLRAYYLGTWGARDNSLGLEPRFKNNPPPILNPPPQPPNNKTSPLLHIGTISGGFNVKGLGGFSVRGRGLMN